MIVLGLTGSIGMGKSATAAIFAEEGVPVHDSDATVHALYAKGGAAVGPIRTAFPEAVKEGAVDRAALARRVSDDPEALKRLEAIVHPLVAAARDAFLERARSAGAEVALLDTPLLYETGQDDAVDAVIVVSAPAEVQRDRVMARPGMTEQKFRTLLTRQTPDSKKRARADFVVDTSRGLEDARAQVRRILKAVTDPAWRPKAGVAGPGEASQ